MSERDTPALVPLMVGTDLPLDPFYVDAFLDRGKRGGEPRLHVIRCEGRCGHWTPSADPDTIEKPGTTAWPGFGQRVGTLALIGRLATGYTPFAIDRSKDRHWDAIDYLSGGHVMAALRSLVAPDDRAWGRAYLDTMRPAPGAHPRASSLAGGYAASAFFPWHERIEDLPWVADVVAYPTPLLAPLATALTEAAAALPATHQAQARLLPVWGLEMGSAHQRLACIREARAAVSTVLRETRNLRTVGGISALVASPVVLDGFDIVEHARILSGKV